MTLDRSALPFNARLIVGVMVGYAISAIPSIFLLRYASRPRLDFLAVATLYGMLFAFAGGLFARKIAHGDWRAGAYMAAAIAATALLALVFQRETVGALPMLTTLVFMVPLALGQPGIDALWR